MTDQAKALRGLIQQVRFEAATSEPPAKTASARTIAVTSGKGGVGKSNIALNLAIALARSGSVTCLLDANRRAGNLDLLCGVDGYWNLSHVMTGARRLQDVIRYGPDNVRLIPGAGGLSDLADCPPGTQQNLVSQLKELEASHHFLIIDTGTGMESSVRHFREAADSILVVTTPEPTAVAEAYATLKSLSLEPDRGAGVADSSMTNHDSPSELELLVNQAESPQQARSVTERMQQTCRLFLDRHLTSAGFIPRDRHVPQAVFRRRALLVDSPDSPAARAIDQLARRLKTSDQGKEASGGFFSRLWERCLGAVGPP